MNTPFNTESSSARKYRDFTLILGCVFLSILITGTVLTMTRFILNLTGLQ